MSIGVILYDSEDSKSMVLANIPNEPDSSNKRNETKRNETKRNAEQNKK